jgi:hypothetical protein
LQTVLQIWFFQLQLASEVATENFFLVASGAATEIFAIASGITTKISPVAGEVATEILRYVFSCK